MLPISRMLISKFYNVWTNRLLFRAKWWNAVMLQRVWTKFLLYHESQQILVLQNACRYVALLVQRRTYVFPCTRECSLEVVGRIINRQAGAHSLSSTSHLTDALVPLVLHHNSSNILPLPPSLIFPLSFSKLTTTTNSTTACMTFTTSPRASY